MSKIQEEMTLTFRKVITIGKDDDAEKYESVDLREPMAGELDKATREVTHVGGVIMLVHLIGKVPLLVAQKMSARDLNRASAFFNSFNAGPDAAADGQN